MEEATGNLILDRLPLEIRAAISTDAKKFSTAAFRVHRMTRWDSYCIFMTKDSPLRRSASMGG